MAESTEVATNVSPPGKTFMAFLDKHKNQLSMALPKHLTADRMSRLALTAFNSNKKLQQCDPKSVFGSVVMLSQMGLEIGVMGQAYLVPYNDRKRGMICQPIPGWMGIVDLVARSGRATVWTGAVYEGDEFDYALGSRPFITHKPCGEDNSDKLIYVYACGVVKGMEHMPVIECWPIARVRKHRNKFNKVGDSHYSFGNWEMYARKVPLLQVCKYMPKSIELTAAISADFAHESGRTMQFDGETVTIEGGDDEPVTITQNARGTAGLKEKAEGGKKPPAQDADHVDTDPETGEVLSGSNAKPAAQPEAEPEERQQRRRPAPTNIE